jgi:hypothetical protein
MSRLITFGDSFTYGHGLVDCHVPEKNWQGPIPSKFAWPQVLGDMLGIEVINKSICGSSNIQILKEILTFNSFEKTDIVIVGWTFNLRDCIFNKNILGVESELRVSAWHKDNKLVEKYFSVHNNHDLSVRTGLYIHHAESYLKTKEVTQYQFSALHQGWYNTDGLPVFIKDPEHFIFGRIINHNTDIALDNSHPGPISHSNAAKKLYEIINAPK